MNRIHTLIVAVTLLAAPSVLADASASQAKSADTCTMSCSRPVGDCCDIPCDLPCAAK